MRLAGTAAGSAAPGGGWPSLLLRCSFYRATAAPLFAEWKGGRPDLRHSCWRSPLLEKCSDQVFPDFHDDMYDFRNLVERFRTKLQYFYWYWTIFPKLS